MVATKLFDTLESNMSYFVVVSFVSFAYKILMKWNKWHFNWKKSLLNNFTITVRFGLLEANEKNFTSFQGKIKSDSLSFVVHHIQIGCL